MPGTPRKSRSRSKPLEGDVRPSEAQKASPAVERKRLVSLDALRGLTILGMLLVNNVMLDTATPQQFRHAGWNQGVNAADLVFPWFIFIVGVAIPYAAASHRKSGQPAWRYDLKVLSRAATLVLLGCLLDSSIYRRPIFDLNVLQLIGLAYMVAALLYDLPVTRRLMLACGFLLAHWAALRFMPIPGIGKGVFTESHNFVNHINQVYLAQYGLQGLASVVTTSALAMIGTAVGDLLRAEPDNRLRKFGYLMAGGAILALIGWAWNLDLPFNKPLWTSSYVVFAAGLGTLALGVFYLVIDIVGWRAWAFPLVVFGMNAIMAYVAPILVKVYIFRDWTWTMPDGSSLPLGEAIPHWFFGHFGHVNGGWAYTSAYILFWWLVLLQMYRKKVFLRV